MNLYKDRDLPLSATILLAIKDCRIAKDKMYSGTSTAHKKTRGLSFKVREIAREIFCETLMLLVSTGSGILGCMATQVQREIVVTQLQIMFVKVLHSFILVHATATL